MAEKKQIVDLNISGNQITNLGATSQNDHAARKDYVDGKFQLIESTIVFAFGNEMNISSVTETNVLFSNTILGVTIAPIDDDGTSFASFDDWVNNGVNANFISVTGNNMLLGAIANNNASGNYKANLKVYILKY
jgi:hypothetical protein